MFMGTIKGMLKGMAKGMTKGIGKWMVKGIAKLNIIFVENGLWNGKGNY